MAQSQQETRITGDAAQFIQEVGKVIAKSKEHEAALKKLTGETKKLTKEEKALAREAKKVYDDIRGPQERHERRVKALNQLVEKGTITQKEYRDAIARTNREYRGAGKAGRDAFGARALGQVQSMITGFLGVSAVVGGITRGFQVWQQNLRETAAEAKKASGEMIAFAALQEGGQKASRVMAAAGLAQRYGITDRAAAFDTVQAMQSVLGSFAKGMATSKEVFAATLAGMKLEDAKEVATLAAGLGFDPGQALRRAHVAGEASSRSPKELAKAAAGLKQWQDREVGWAAAATLAGTGRAEELRTYLKRGGIALSRQPGAVQKKFEGMGLGEAGQLERLEALAKLGVTTPEAAGRFGFTEIREMEAVSDLVSRLPELKKTLATIRAEAKPGLFQRERADVEAELPITKSAREQDILKTMIKDEQIFGPRAERAARLARSDLITALALRRVGIEQTMFMDTITQEGELTGAGKLFWRGTTDIDVRAAKKEIRDTMAQQTLEELKEINRQLGVQNRQRPVKVNDN